MIEQTGTNKRGQETTGNNRTTGDRTTGNNRGTTGDRARYLAFFFGLPCSWRSPASGDIIRNSPSLIFGPPAHPPAHLLAALTPHPPPSPPPSYQPAPPCQRPSSDSAFCILHSALSTSPASTSPLNAPPNGMYLSVDYCALAEKS